jgi:hypothetical protein
MLHGQDYVMIYIMIHGLHYVIVIHNDTGQHYVIVINNDTLSTKHQNLDNSHMYTQFSHIRLFLRPNLSHRN